MHACNTGLRLFPFLPEKNVNPECQMRDGCDRARLPKPNVKHAVQYVGISLIESMNPSFIAL